MEVYATRSGDSGGEGVESSVQGKSGEARDGEGQGAQEGQTDVDHKHNLVVLGSYKLGGGWKFGAGFRLSSGNLVTPTVCNPEQKTVRPVLTTPTDGSAPQITYQPACDPNRINSIYHAPSGAYTQIPFGGVASERLPMFHALDLRLDKRWQMKSWQFSAYLDVQNVYSNQNVEGLQYNFNYTSRQYVTGIPILPSIGLRGEM